MRVPYDTGKVKIGSNYHPDLRPAIDCDMEYLQTALIGDISSIKKQRAAIAVYVASLLAVIFGAILLT